MKRFILFLILFATQSGSLVNAQDRNPIVYKLNMKEEIAPGIWRQTRQAFEAADSLGADLVLIHMNTYGGTVVDADSIRTRIMQSKIPVVVFVDNNAASAGALISIAADSIYMRPGGSIGAATVVNQTGAAMPDKFQSYFRSIMRATAESHGKIPVIENGDTIYKWRRDPLIAEAMVDPSVYIKGIIDTGKVLTFTPSEAIRYGFSEGTAETVTEVLQKMGLENATIIEYKPTFIEKIIGYLVHPVVSGILIMAIIGGIYFEMQTPGLGFPIAVSILAAVAYFAPLYLEGLAEHWEILVFLAGIILILIEIFVIPGFGVSGIIGIFLAFTGLTLSLIDNIVFDFGHVDMSRIGTAVLTVVIGISGGFFLSLWASSKVFGAHRGPFRNMALQAVQNVDDGFVSIDNSLMKLKGQTGIAHSVLRPSGKVEIDGEIYDAVTAGEFIDKGKSIQVIKVEATQLYVEMLR
jgi:membrane-bound serine protease (ClpP class)